MLGRNTPRPGNVYQANGFRHEVIMQLPNSNPHVRSLLVTTRCTRCNAVTSTKCLYYRPADFPAHIQATVSTFTHSHPH